MSSFRVADPRYALVDHDGLIQREARSTRAAVQRPPPAVNGGVPGGRFQKRVREDGSALGWLVEVVVDFLGQTKAQDEDVSRCFQFFVDRMFEG